MSLKVALTGFLADASGYGEMARRILGALEAAGADVAPGISLQSGAPQLPQQPTWLQGFLARPGFDKIGDLADVHLMCVAANEFQVLPYPARRQAGMLCWETDQLHVSFQAGCAGLDRVIVPSRFNAEIFRSGGVPAISVPFPAAAPEGDAIALGEISDSTVVFYSMLTWQERKNPRGLLVAYLTAFTGFDDVVLVLKVNGPRFLKSRIEGEIGELIEAINRPNAPRVVVVVDTWSQERIWALHRRGDCFALLTRGESFTLPALDALVMGTQVLITDWGGHIEYLFDDRGGLRDGVALVRSRLTPVVQNFPYFTGDQAWADPDILHAADLMREMFKNGRVAKKTHDLGHLTPAAVGFTLVEALGGD